MTESEKDAPDGISRAIKMASDFVTKEQAENEALLANRPSMEPACYATFLNGKIDYSEMCVASNIGDFDISDYPEGVEIVALYSEDQLTAKDALIRELVGALRMAANGLRHCARWNISEKTERAIISHVMTIDAALSRVPAELLERRK